MRNYILNIADYRIKFQSSSDGPELEPSQRFHSFLSDEAGYDILIRVHHGRFKIPDSAEKVFDAPYVEEINGIKIKKKEIFWSVYRKEEDIFIVTSFPVSDENKNAVLKFTTVAKIWEMWIEGPDLKVDPLEYPLDGLILYYLTAIHGDLMIHASGINNGKNGYVFSGISGKGKTTMSRLWDKSGSRVIHDDRLIIRKKEKDYLMYNTPVYNNDSPRESVVNRLFLIGHGKENKIIPVSGAESVSLVMANCIQHHWNTDIITRLLGSVSELCSEVPVSKLYFKPDMSVIDHILRHE